MARSRTLTLMLADVRMHAGMENSTFCTDAEITEYLNQGISDYWDELCKLKGNQAYSTATITTVAGTETVAVPADFFYAKKLTIEIAGATRELIGYDLSQREEFMPVASWRGQPLVFCVVGATLSILPICDQVYSGTLYYMKCATRLTTGSDTLDGIDGWEEYAIQKAVFDCLSKEESDTTACEKRMARLLQRVNMLGGHLNSRQAPRIRDAYNTGIRLRKPWQRLPRP